MLCIQISASPGEWKWEFVVSGQPEGWALWWNLFLCMASTLNRPPIMPADRGVDGIFTRGKETNLGQKWFSHLFPDELWSSALAKWCEIIALELLISLSSGFCHRLCDNRKWTPVLGLLSGEAWKADACWCSTQLLADKQRLSQSEFFLCWP